MKRLMILLILLPVIVQAQGNGPAFIFPGRGGSSTSGVSWLANPSTGTPYSISWPDTSRGFKFYNKANVIAVDTVPSGTVMWTLQNIATTGEAVLKIHNNNNQGLEIKQYGSLVSTTTLRSASMLQFNSTTAFYMSSNLKQQIWTTSKAGTFVDAAKEKMRLDADGNFGIGKYAMQLFSKLEVGGGIRADTIIAPMRVIDTTNVATIDSIKMLHIETVQPLSNLDGKYKIGSKTYEFVCPPNAGNTVQGPVLAVVSDSANNVKLLTAEFEMTHGYDYGTANAFALAGTRRYTIAYTSSASVVGASSGYSAAPGGVVSQVFPLQIGSPYRLQWHVYHAQSVIWTKARMTIFFVMPSSATSAFYATPVLY